MRILVHLSDLHFGKADPVLLEPLLQSIEQIAPDVVVISGDLTQRARAHQFKEARAFLDRLKAPTVVIPGNHDIPLNVIERFAMPLTKYRRHIARDIEPTYQDDEVSIFSINTARSLTTDRGSISTAQLNRAARFFAQAKPGAVRIVVTHHPFDFPRAIREKYRVRRAQRAMEVLARHQADLFLAGHAHRCFTVCSAERYRIAGYSALIVQAGTSISSRTRDEPNSFNVLRIARPYISVQSIFWSPEKRQFVGAQPANFQHSGQGWQPSTSIEQEKVG
ncbi:MAG TPA: metallophosphoesterase family protein [Terriglobales bacterium]|nr:metallophosphoesterase family protein [Terriglobales bacterium]